MKNDRGLQKATLVAEAKVKEKEKLIEPTLSMVVISENCENSRGEKMFAIEL